uniref:Uncharacterized protein n=1 Tax=Setaria italica TaxID=4555 RepID=K3Y3T3_SETIT
MTCFVKSIPVDLSSHHQVGQKYYQSLNNSEYERYFH